MMTRRAIFKGVQPAGKHRDRSRPAGSTQSITRRRTKAFLVDLAVITGLSMALIIFLMDRTALSPSWLGLAAPALFSVLGLIYFALTQGSPMAASPGMKVYKLRLRLRQGGSLGYKAALLRSVIFYVTITIFTPLILLMIPLTRGRRAFHDLFVGGAVFDAAQANKPT